MFEITLLQVKGLRLPYKAPYPLSTDYRPEIDLTPELGEADASYYHTLIGVLFSLLRILSLIVLILLLSTTAAAANTSFLSLACSFACSNVLVPLILWQLLLLRIWHALLAVIINVTTSCIMVSFWREHKHRIPVAVVRMNS